MKKALVTVLILGLLGAGGYGAYYYFYLDKGNDGERVSSTSEDAVYVDSVSAITGFGSGTGLYDRYGGEVEPQATMEVKLESERTVAECYVKVGDEVKEGQKLFTYDTQEDEDKLAQAEIEIERCKGDIEVAQEEIEQAEKEKAKADEEDKLAYTTQILTAQNTIKRSEYEIKTHELEIEQLKDGMENATVYAEMAGIIQKIADPNQTDYSYSYSDSNESAYITILALGDYRIKGSVNEQNLKNLDTGMPVIVYSRVDSSLTWKGTISEINTDNKEDNSQESNYYYYGESAGSSSYSFYVELENSEGLILGQHVYMEADAGQNDQKDGLWLEEYYILQEDEKAYVWLANSSNVIEKYEITLGDYDGELMEYEVTDGLDGEDYIAFPTDDMEEGLPVIYNDYSSAADDLMSGDDYSDMESYEDWGAYDDMDQDLAFGDGEYGSGEDLEWDDSEYEEDGSYYDDYDEFEEDGSYYDADMDEFYDMGEEFADEGADSFGTFGEE